MKSATRAVCPASTSFLLPSSPFPRSSQNAPETALTYPQDLSPTWIAGHLLEEEGRLEYPIGRRVATRIDPLSDCLESVMSDVQVMSIGARSSRELAGSTRFAGARCRSFSGIWSLMEVALWSRALGPGSAPLHP
jgi:hypothetical protein